MRLGGSGRTRINPNASMVGDGEVPLQLPPLFYRSAPACAYLATADASNLLLVFSVSFAETDRHMGRSIIRAWLQIDVWGSLHRHLRSQACQIVFAWSAVLEIGSSANKVVEPALSWIANKRGHEHFR
jgi:hypothetical protein